jgi:hypothetical protein
MTELEIKQARDKARYKYVNDLANIYREHKDFIDYHEDNKLVVSFSDKGNVKIEFIDAAKDNIFKEDELKTQYLDIFNRIYL